MAGGLGSSLPLLSDTTGGSAPIPPKTAECDVAVRYADNLSVTKRYNPTLAIGVGMAPAVSYAFRPGAIISEVVRMQPSQAVTMRYGWTVNEQIYMTSALSSAMPALVADGIGVAPAIAVSLGVSLLQGIGLAPVPLPSLRYTQTLVETIAMSPHLGLLFGALLSEHVGSHDALSTMYRPQPVLADGIGIAPTLSNKLMLTVVLNETIGLDDAQLLHAIYDGQLADQVQIVASYIAPNGNFTTWAMNTRSGAVTEYSNYAFNSFAMVGDRYYGAGPQGLYKLLGDTDDGTSIIADLKSGFAQWGGSKFTLLKYAYLGVRGAGTFVLKLITGDGKTYIYSAQAKNQQTTKVHLGKGLRARYFRFELIGDGADFDLDTIEFVPLVAERRD